MKSFFVRTVVAGLLCFISAGCGASESGSPEDTGLAKQESQTEGKENEETISASPENNMSEYFNTVEGKLVQLKGKHAKLVEQVQQAGLSDKSKTTFDETLSELVKKGDDVEKHIGELKLATGDEWLSLRSGMDESLKELDQMYETALSQFVGQDPAVM